MSYCDRLWHATYELFDVLEISMKYLQNATFRTILEFQMSVLEMLENKEKKKDKLGILDLQICLEMFRVFFCPKLNV